MNISKTSMLVALLSLFAIGFAHAGDDEACDMHGHQDGMKNADTNSDGKLSYDEYRAFHEQRMEKHFKRMDANSDGFVDATEKQAMRDKMREMFKQHHKKMQDGSGNTSN